MEINLILWGFSFIWGVLLGLFYFGGLWMTLTYISRSKRPKSSLVLSFVIRILLVLIGFWAIIRLDPVAFMLTFSAFLITRVILTRSLGRESRGEIHAHQS
jgi:F1F0 ATPase subunit 2